MINNPDGTYSKSFFALAGVSIAGILGGVYYLYTLLKGEPELSEEVETQIEEIAEKVQTGELNVENAVKIMAMTNKVAEDIIKKSKSDIDTRRREALNNGNEYEKICYEYLEAKEYAYHTASSAILNKFNISMEDLQRVLSKVSPYELEQRLYESEKPAFENNNRDMDRETTKKAFLYYGNKFLGEMNEFQKIMQSIEQSQQEYIMFRLMILKMKIDDELWFKYEINEQQMRYKLYEHKLHDDTEVKRLHDRITRFDENMGMAMQG